jgi:hypothetical protein
MERGSGSPTGLRSYYNDKSEKGADLIYTDDEVLADLERIDHQAERMGVEQTIPGFDEGKVPR